jgi:hypothetical protein
MDCSFFFFLTQLFLIISLSRVCSSSLIFLNASVCLWSVLCLLIIWEASFHTSAWSPTFRPDVYWAPSILGPMQFSLFISFFSIKCLILLNSFNDVSLPSVGSQKNPTLYHFPTHTNRKYEGLLQSSWTHFIIPRRKCGGAVTVSFSKYLPWQAMYFIQRSTHFWKRAADR